MKVTTQFNDGETAGIFMKRHTKIYMKFFGYDTSDFIPSEISGQKAEAIHHIDCRGMGGNPKGDKDDIRNLMALTAKEHDKYGDKKQHMEFLQQKHYSFMRKRGKIETHVHALGETLIFK